MSNPTPALANLNGRLIPADELAVSVYDMGFVMGATVTERIRTFGGKLFGLEEHLDRFEQSLQIIDLQPACGREELAAMANDLAARNHALLEEGDDLVLCLFATPGADPTMATPAAGPMVAMHTDPVPFRQFADKYESGQAVVIPQVRQMSPRVLPPQLKCRSRMHYYLADQQARRIDPAARALMLDGDDFVLEATTANVLIHAQGEGLVSPPLEKILPGISVAATLQLAERLDIPHTHRDLRTSDLLAADEVMLTSTSMCVLPVVKLDGQPIGAGRPGAIFRRLLAAWSDLAGLDVVAQARRFRGR